jgi:perosamine synthetase
MKIERISDLERKYINDVLQQNFRSSSGGKYMKLLEQEFAKKFNNNFGISFVNGTATMHACLEAWGIGEGDEVIVTPLTMSSTTFCVLHANATPIYADVDKKTFNMDPDSIMKNITSRTKAIIPVSLFGLSPDMEKIMKIAKDNNLKVLEDNAECFLGKYKNKLVGEYGDAASYSFQSSKHLTSGEGGMVITDDEEFANNLRKVQSLGYAALSNKTAKISKDEIQDPSYFRHSSLGWNYRMPELCCAVAYAQVERLEELVNIRKLSGELFNQAIKGNEKYLTPQFVPDDYENSYWTWAATIYDESLYHEFRDQFIKAGGDRFYGAWKLGYQEPFLRDKNLLNREKYLTKEKYDDGICPVAEDLQKRLMCFKTNYWDLDDAKHQSDILNDVCRRIFN